MAQQENEYYKKLELRGHIFHANNFWHHFRLKDLAVLKMAAILKISKYSTQPQFDIR